MRTTSQPGTSIFGGLVFQRVLRSARDRFATNCDAGSLAPAESLALRIDCLRDKMARTWADLRATFAEIRALEARARDDDDPALLRRAQTLRHVAAAKLEQHQAAAADLNEATDRFTGLRGDQIFGGRQ